jgi:UDP-N-acetylglucosamine--N-acetylmuramyl-(pentapeptide) pyrophosphoryl-undecaprenol N-acetylglucosamine transferase
VVLCGGGTGGHLFPGIAVAQELRRRHPDWRLLFVGTARGIEVRAVPQYGFELQLLPVLPLRGRGLRGVVTGLWAVPRALWRARAMLKAARATVAVGVGGYAAGPALLAAWSLGLPTAIMEQNAHAGLTNRLLGRLCHDILLAMPNRQLGGRRGARVVGNPVRQDLIALGAQAKPYPEAFTAKRPLRLLVMGGSQGARALNDAMLALLPRLAGLPIAVRHQSGAADYHRLAEAYGRHPELTAQVTPFIDDMAQAYGEADVALCRSGASTLAELAVVGLPSVLVPYPFAADDHQTANAQVMVRQGGGHLLPQKDLGGPALLDLLRGWLESPATLGDMAGHARANGRPQAVTIICDIIEAGVQRVQR